MEPVAGRMDFKFETMHGDLVADTERHINQEIAADRRSASTSYLGRRRSPPLT